MTDVPDHAIVRAVQGELNLSKRFDSRPILPFTSTFRWLSLVLLRDSRGSPSLEFTPRSSKRSGQTLALITRHFLGASATSKRLPSCSSRDESSRERRKSRCLRYAGCGAYCGKFYACVPGRYFERFRKRAYDSCSCSLVSIPPAQPARRAGNQLLVPHVRNPPFDFSPRGFHSVNDPVRS